MKQADDTTIVHLFSTPVMTYDLPDSKKLNDALKKAIRAKRDEEDGITRSNIGGWHSDDHMLQWANPHSGVVINAAVEKLGKLVTQRDQSERVEVIYSADMWANINKPGDSNAMHCHPGALYAGVYYVDIGDDGSGANIEGQLQVHDPRHPMTEMYAPKMGLLSPDGKPQSMSINIQPANGRMVLFPAWLMHSVRPYKGSRERISIAFNIYIADYAPVRRS